MLLCRVVAPSDASDGVVALLLGHGAVHNLVQLRGAARRPDGDLIEFDIAPEAANDVLALLRSEDLHRRGSITVTRVDLALSDTARDAERLAPGESNEAVIWEEVEARVRDEAALTVSHLALMTVAVAIAACGILLDSTVLIVGSMVVGPDFGPVSGLIVNLYRRRWPRAVDAVRTLGISLVAGMLAAAALVALTRAAGRVPESYLGGVRPLTSFVARPDGWSVVVAGLAAIAGTLSLLEAKAGPLVGVLISVTTVPAAANVAVALAMGKADEAHGAALQLGLNLSVLVVTGVLVLSLWRRRPGAGSQRW